MSSTFRLIALGILLLAVALSAREDAAPSSTVNGVTVNLNAGWNGVGFQATQLTQLSANPSVAGVASFANGTYQIGNYALGDINAGGGGRRGFWIFATASTSFTYSGTGGPDFVDLVSGYNLVSFCTSADIPGANLTATVNGATVPLGSVVLATFFEIGPNNVYTPVDVTAGGTLKPGHAYWVFASNSVRLNAGSGSPSPSPGASPSPGGGAGPTQVQFTQQPTGVKGGTAFSVGVRLVDAQGNLVTTATNTVTISLAKDPTKTASLGGAVSKPASGGVVSFSELTLNQAGAGFQLQAAATGLTTATSNPFNVSAQTISFAPATLVVQNNNNGGQQNSQGLAVADFDNDGHQDVAVGNPQDATAAVSIFYGLGNGMFTEKRFVLNNGWVGTGVAVGQFGTDPKFPDLVVGTPTGAVALLLNNGSNRTFTERDITVTNVFTSKLCTLDVNGDGKRDIALGDDNSRKLYTLINSGDNMNFTTQITDTAFANSFSGVRSADMDNDGKPDIVCNVFNNATPAFVLWNTGNANGYFVNDNPAQLPLPGTSRGFNLGDFNNDGKVDVLLVNNNGTPPFGRPYQNNGNRTFTALPDQLVTGGTGDTSGGGNTQCGVFADLNVDGALDIVLGNAGPPKNATLPGIDFFTNVLTGVNAVFGGDQFAASFNNVGFRAVDTGDFNEDTRPDVVGMNSFTTGGLVIYLNTSK